MHVYIFLLKLIFSHTYIHTYIHLSNHDIHILYAVDPELYCERLSQAVKAKQLIAATVTINLYVDCMPVDNLKPLDSEQVSHTYMHTYIHIYTCVCLPYAEHIQYFSSFYYHIHTLTNKLLDLILQYTYIHTYICTYSHSSR